MALKYICKKCGASKFLAKQVETVKCPACDIPMELVGQAETESDKANAEQKTNADSVAKQRKTAETVSSGIATGPEAAKHTAELKVAKPVAETGGYTTTDTARALVNKAEQDARDIRAAAEKDAEATKQQIIDAAKKEAEKLKSEAAKAAEKEGQKTADKIKNEARETAEKIKAEAQGEANKLKSEAQESRAQAQKALQDAEKRAAALDEKTKKSSAAGAKNTAEERRKPEPQKAEQPAVGAVQKKEINAHLKREARFLLAGISFSLVVLLFCFILVTQANLGGALRMMTYVVIIFNCALFGVLSWIIWGHYREGKAAMERHKKRQADKRLERRNAKKKQNSRGTGGGNKRAPKKGSDKPAQRQKQQAKTSVKSTQSPAKKYVAEGKSGRGTNTKNTGASKNKKNTSDAQKSVVNKTKRQNPPPQPGRNKKK